jgi:hypothetical protein
MRNTFKYINIIKCFLSIILILSVFFYNPLNLLNNNLVSVFTQKVFADTWDITHTWDTGDLNLRVTSVTAVFDRDHTGSSVHILAPIQHGVKAYDSSGNLEWTYSGITNGYDVRDLAVGDLNGTGYNDSSVIASGYYTASTDGKFAILDKDGNQLQLFTGADFAAANVSTIKSLAIDGTDIYVGHALGITKFVKSGSTWSEDSTGWNKSIGDVREIEITDTGNGKRVYAVAFDSNLYSYQTDGTEDWNVTPGSYAGQIEIGNVDNTIPGDEIVAPRQTGTNIYDKDGNLLSVINEGTNVRTGVTLYDSDSNGEDEIYFADMGSDIFSYERTGINTYSKKYSVLDSTSAVSGLINYDIDADGEDEIMALGIDGHLKIFSADLSIVKKDLNIGHGDVGGYDYNYIHNDHGTVFADTSLDGHADIIVSGGTGYVDVYETSGFTQIPSSGALSCSITTSAACTGTVLLRMSGMTNAHAELPSQSTAVYNGNVVCCTGVTGLGNSCAASNHEVIARLSGVTNAHIEKNDQSGVNYTQNACLSSSLAGDDIKIGYQSSNCDGYDTTLFSMEKSPTNSMIGIPTAYNNKVCAKISSQSISFNLSANSVGFGNLTSSGLRYATSDGSGSSSETESYHIDVSTNAPYGYGVYLRGDSLKNGSIIIDPIGGTNTIPTPGSNLFGLRAVATGGSGTVATPYDGSGFAYDATSSTNSTLAQASSGDGSTTTYSIRTVATIDSLLDPGNYSTNLTYIVTANF